MVEVDAVEDLVEFAKIERSGGTVPQLTKTGTERRCPSASICLWIMANQYSPRIALGAGYATVPQESPRHPDLVMGLDGDSY